jgi:hypothetical protein
MHEGRPAINGSRALRTGIEKLSRRISGRIATVVVNEDEEQPRTVLARILGR